ncbi:hypothetical protein [Psychrilyobacter atlanticus]|uniref:hypothetical protein n=1 Tax=Psychrilyobacter atlanticus TaxID=271091 RepID=UPI00048C5444|nr:hypothetical protein [Psychrilyobacter atlanticus]
MYTLLKEISTVEYDYTDMIFDENEPIESIIDDLKTAKKLEILCQTNDEFREYIDKFSEKVGIFA